ATEWSEGVATRVVAYDVGSGAITEVATDADASHAIPVGDGTVVYVSTHGGVASLWRAAPHAVPHQLTNVGLAAVDATFVPAPANDAVWLPGTHVLVYAAHYDDEAVWKIDVDSGEAELLGPGAMPQLDSDGAVLAVSNASSDCASTYLGGEP